MDATQRTALVKEGKLIIERTDEDSWRLAEIVHDLHADGMTYQAIADEFGWKDHRTPSLYERTLEWNRDSTRFADAFLFAGMSGDRAIAVEAVADAEGISPHTAKTRSTVKELVAQIANLPDDEKRTAARELALDPTFAIEGAQAVEKDMDDRRKTHRREHGPTQDPTTALDETGVMLALSVLELDVKKAESEMEVCTGEVYELAMLRFNSIEERIRNMRIKVMGNVDDWSEAAKKELI